MIQKNFKKNYKRPVQDKRPTNIKRDLLSSSHHAYLLLSYLKEAYIHQKRPIYIKRNLFISKETSKYQKKPAELLSSRVSAPLISERGQYNQKRPKISKETC